MFFDLQGLASGDFESVILENIRARAHFLVLLTPSSLDRCDDPNDLFRREIEEAIAKNRNIVPVMVEGFTFSGANVDKQLGESLALLKAYNGLPVYPEYFTAAMEKLRNNFLSIPLEMILFPASLSARQAADEEKTAASEAAPVTQELLKEAGEPRHLFTIKLRYNDTQQWVMGTRAEEPYGEGSLTIYDGSTVAARYYDKVESWARHAPH